MKKLVNILKKCTLVLAIGLILSSIPIPTPGEINPTHEIGVCGPTEEPEEIPFTDEDYI